MICLWSEGDACLHSHLNEAKHKNVLCPWFSFWDKHGSLRFCPLLLLRNAVLYFRLAFLNAFHCAWDPSFGRSRWNNVVRRDKVSTCRSKFNFFNYLVIFRRYLTGNGKVSCILATISDWFPNINRASDISQKKKSNFTGFLATKLRKNRSISREFSGQTWPESNRWKNGGICGYFQGKFRNKSIGFALIRLAFLMFF